MFSKTIGMCLALASTGAVSQAPNPASAVPQFPELTPRATLVSIIKALDSTIADPRSISDVVLCPPTRIRFSKRDGRPESWYVAFSMNARTADGGYGGRVMYGATFKTGRPTKIYRTQANTDEGFDHLINNAIRKQMKDCPAVSNEQLSTLIGASDRPTVDVSQ